MPWLFVLVNIAFAMTIGVAPSEDASRSSQIERPIMIRKGNILPRNRNAIFIEAPFLFLLHLLKLKSQYPKLEKISTTTPLTRDCVCVPFYLCNANQTVITDGVGVIDVRIRRCTGDLEVCCYLPNITGSTTPAVTPAPTTAAPTTQPTSPTTASTAPPTTASTTVIFPTISPIPPVTGPPGLNCVCVEISLCDPNGIVTISGEGIINPRRGYRLCPGANQVCCRILVGTTQSPTSPPTSMTPAPTMTVPTVSVPPGQTQVCFVCGGIIQCVTCGIIIAPGSGAIDPRLPLSRDGLCSNRPTCQGTTVSSRVDPPVITDLLGPLKNPGTPQACYCVKTWLCSEGNVVSPDGLGIIDARFTACPTVDQVCCRSTGIDLQTLRLGNDASAPTSGTFIVNGPSSGSSVPQMICGIRNNSYAPLQPFPADSGRTYFAEFPWMVALLVKPASGPYVFQCGASMINNRAILTAAHCVANRTPGSLVVRFGQWNVANNTQPLPTQEANILAIASHPLYYSGGLFHDVAVLVLDKPIVYSANVLPICLPEQGMIFLAGTRCYGTGWGRTSFGPEGKYQTELRKVDLPIVDHADCQTRLRSTRLGQYFQLHGSFICAGGEANRDTCTGDGGGPLTCQTATGQFFQAGIVSWGIGCGTTNVPAVYASVSQHRQWIDKQLATYGVQ